MKPAKGTLKTCSRGHRFRTSSDCPVCPICWPGYERKKAQSDFPEQLSAPALRALQNAGIKNMTQLKSWTEVELLELHGMGPTGIAKLKTALKGRGWAFVKP